MKKLIISIALYIVSRLLSILMFLPILIYTIYKHFAANESSEYVAQGFYSLAQAYDEVGNVWGKELWNDVLITKDGYQFGLPGERMSSVIGKNCETQTLTKTGIWLNNQLNKIQVNHSIKSIQKVVT